MIIIKINYASTLPNVNITYDNSVIYAKVVYGDGNDGTATWGLINGTLSNQTDLQNALNAKVPYSGATANVDLGEYELKAGQVELDQTPTGVAGVAVTRWNDTVGTIETTLKGGNVVLKHGRDMFERVVNKTGIQLTKAAYQAVKVSDAQGQRLAVDLAQANNDNNSADTIGIVVETIDNNQEGFIYTVGEVDGINTTGSLQSEIWSDGDVLYLSPTTAGRITNVKPVAPQHLVIMGYVVYAHANNGKIYVKITNGYELGELHDVNTTGATNGQVLAYNSTSAIWEPTTNGSGTVTSVGVTAGTGISVSGSPITSSGSITVTNSAPDQVVSLTGAGTTSISGTYPSFTITSNDQYVGTVTSVGLTSATSGVTIGSSPITTSGNISLTIATASGSQNGLLSSTDWTTFNNKQNALTNPVTGTGTSGQVAYWSGTNTQTGSNNLFWDATNSRLGIGTNAPSQKLTILDGAFAISNTAAGGEVIKISVGGTTSVLAVTLNGASAFEYTTVSNNTKGQLYVRNSHTNSFPAYSFLTDTDTGISNANGTADTLSFITNATERMRLNATGNIGIGTINGYATKFAVEKGSQSNTVNLSNSAAFLYGADVGLAIGQQGASPYGTWAQSISTGNVTYPLFLNPSGSNVIIGSMSDSGEKLQVTGTMKVTGATTLGATTISTSSSTALSINSSAAACFLGMSDSSGSFTYLGSDNGAMLFQTPASSYSTKMTLDNAGNLGLGVTPSAWGSTAFKVIEGTYASNISYDLNNPILRLATNAYNDGTNWIYKISSFGASRFDVHSNSFQWHTAPSGTAGGTITFTRAMTLDSSGSLGLGASSPISFGTGISSFTFKGTNSSVASRAGAIIFESQSGSDGSASIYVNAGNISFYNSATTYASATEKMRLTNGGNLLIGTTTDSGEKLVVSGTAKITSKLSMGAGTTSNAQINLASSTAPTSPNDGDIWFDGTDIKMRIGGVTKTFTLT